MVDCSICCNTTTATTSIKGRVLCSSCDFVACRGCVQTYLLNVYNTPNCMNCKTVWSYTFLEDNLQKKYMNGQYRKHYENCLLAKEKALLSKARPYALLKIESEKAWDRLQAAKVVLEALCLYRYRDSSRMYKRLIKKQIKEVEEAKNNRRKVLNKRIDNTYQSMYFCTKVGCGGLIGSDWICTQCKSCVCSECHQIIQDEQHHKCSQDDLSTIRILKKETRTCPGCASCIYKIDGCDQMFCVNCKTAFSWKTGCTIKGRIHNPHYYEYLRNRDGQAPPEGEGDLNELVIPFVAQSVAALHACEEIMLNRPDIQQLYNIKKNVLPGRRLSRRRLIRRILRMYLRSLDHFIEVILPEWMTENSGNKNIDLRILYILGRIDEHKWKRILRLREKVFNKKTRVYNILEHFRRMFEEKIRIIWFHTSCEEIIESIDAITSIRQYTNQRLRHISMCENVTTPYITNMFRVLTQNKYGISENWIPIEGEILHFYV